jgi:FMN phosphatase YigB (HAD superfamily)
VVGDSWAADVVGARNARLPAIWFNPHHRPMPPGSPVTELVSLRPAGSPLGLIRAEAANRSWRRLP